MFHEQVSFTKLTRIGQRRKRAERGTTYTFPSCGIVLCPRCSFHVPGPGRKTTFPEYERKIIWKHLPSSLPPPLQFLLWLFPFSLPDYWLLSLSFLQPQQELGFSPRARSSVGKEPFLPKEGRRGERDIRAWGYDGRNSRNEGGWSKKDFGMRVRSEWSEGCWGHSQNLHLGGKWWAWGTRADSMGWGWMRFTPTHISVLILPHPGHFKGSIQPQFSIGRYISAPLHGGSL